MQLHRNQLWAVIIGIYGFMGGAAGAAGAHIVSDPMLASMVEKAAFYQLIHTLGLMAMATQNGRAAQLARLCWCVGIILFCGSLYVKGFALATSAPIAPFGGILLMVGWLIVPFTTLTRKE